MRHEVHLARVGFFAVLPIAVIALGAGMLAAGGRGLTSAGIGVGLVAANHLVAVSSTGWASTMGPRVIAVGYAVFVLRMLALLVAFAIVASFAWIHTGFFVASFCAALLTMLTAECLSYARGSYIPSWRTK